MTTWRVTAGCVLVALGATACSSGDGSSTATTAAARTTTTTTTAPARPASTTTTAYDPAAVEGQVEAAYLRSWDVYADAVYNLQLDESALSEVYAERSLENKLTEIQDRILTGRAALVRVDHRYDVLVLEPGVARVVDRLVNHQVLIDPVSKTPIEADPDQRLVFNFLLHQSDGVWRVAMIERVNL